MNAYMANSFECLPDAQRGISFETRGMRFECLFFVSFCLSTHHTHIYTRHDAHIYTRHHTHTCTTHHTHGTHINTRQIAVLLQEMIGEVWMYLSLHPSIFLYIHLSFSLSLCILHTCLFRRIGVSSREARRGEDVSVSHVFPDVHITRIHIHLV